MGGVKVTLDERAFYVWTFPSAEFSVYLPAWLSRVMGFMDFASLMVPFHFHSDLRHPIVEITKCDVDGKSTKVEITRSNTTAKHSQASVRSTISKYSFHCNVSKEAYVSSQMAKVILMHRVNTD